MKERLFSPAKINLCLHVLGKRPDGYHELAMLMQSLDFGDTLEIELTDQPGEITVYCAGVDLPAGAENIAAKAARRLLALSGKRVGVRIVIDKKIPVAAGLGGGSSNAAATLRGLNKLLDLQLSKKELMAEGVKLGADVPFFLFNDRAWATGIGDQLASVPPLPLAWYVLVNPGISISTAWAYQNLGLTAPPILTKLPRFPNTLDDLVAILENDLERVTIKRYPLLAEIKKKLIELGARGSLMSGSGSTIFGLFAEEAQAVAAAEMLRSSSDWRIITTQPLLASAE
jgi:4-diphosphocytidyl-2-C-methyl-D-erythritol kinase